MTVAEKLKSRKFLLTVVAVGYALFKSDPKYAAVATSVYVFVQGLIDLFAGQGVILTEMEDPEEV